MDYRRIIYIGLFIIPVGLMHLFGVVFIFPFLVFMNWLTRSNEPVSAVWTEVWREGPLSELLTDPRNN